MNVDVLTEVIIARPKAEVSFLLDLLRRFIQQDVAELHAANVRIKIIGDRLELDKSLIKMLDEAEKLTADNTKLTLVVAFNYGSRQELVRTSRRLAEAVKAGSLAPEAITLDLLQSQLDTAAFPDPDLLIRTGGEQRLSNFLLWQCAYTEFVFVEDYWPDFDAAVLARAIEIYRSRERRFGGLKAHTA